MNTGSSKRNVLSTIVNPQLFFYIDVQGLSLTFLIFGYILFRFEPGLIELQLRRFGMRNFILPFTVLVLLMVGCKNNTSITEPSDSAKGQVLLKFDSVNQPENVQTVIAVLSRQGYSNRTVTLNLLTDTTASAMFTEVPIGMWHLKVDAKDNAGQVVYTGETDVNVLANIQLQVTLTLNPVQGSNRFNFNICSMGYSFKPYYMA